MLNITEAVTKAKAAASSKMKNYLEQNKEDYYCGFAWVEIIVARTNSPEAKELLSLGFEKSYKPRTLQYWGADNYHGQCMNVKEAFSKEFARVLQECGLKAYMASRAD